jgi:hypothetical protein
MEEFRRDIFLGSQPPHSFLVNKKDAIENAMLPHQILGGGNLLFRLLFLLVLGLIVTANQLGWSSQRSDTDRCARYQESSAIIFHFVSP